ncbi:MAG: sulfur carrier protein ThiS [Nitrospirae bacterium]|nr:sulfur carrier protein ThiS [Nitrospirota bacterium]
MKLRINGEDYETEKEKLTELLTELQIVPERVAVEVNLKVIKRDAFDHYNLREGDNIEIVYFVGGGN